MVEEIVRYGLFFGAMFQLLCVAAVIFIPSGRETGKDVNESSDEETSMEGSPHINPYRPLSHVHKRAYTYKQDKKKRR